MTIQDTICNCEPDSNLGCKPCPKCKNHVVEWAYRWHVEHCSKPAVEFTDDDLRVMTYGPRTRQALHPALMGFGEMIKQS